MTTTFSLVHRLDELDASGWNRLAGSQPFVQYAFLQGLYQTGCAAGPTGWAPHYLLMRRDGALVGAMPLYLKSHSRGEYVFDHGWAQAFAQHGLDYYPKLLCAVPFTPVPGPRLLAATHQDRVALARQAIQLTEQNGISSLHVLFPHPLDQAALEEAGFMVRENVQFHWFNEGYQDFAQFLASLSQQKRKKINQDRKKSIQAGISFTWLNGDAIDDDSLKFFYRCYEQTYLEHGNPPYLNLAFFGHLRAHMAENLVIVLAHRQGTPVAAALNLRDQTHLYGRYWGSMTYIPGLHFETCYMQGIEYCISHGLSVFEGGAQGEHKLSRGLMPVRTCSAHWIADPRYARAIADFLDQEGAAVGQYIDTLKQHAPFKNTH